MPGFEYHWDECVKKFIGMCAKWEHRVDLYDLRDPSVRDKLVAMGFVGRVRGKVLP